MTDAVQVTRMMSVSVSGTKESGVDMPRRQGIARLNELPAIVARYEADYGPLYSVTVKLVNLPGPITGAEH